MGDDGVHTDDQYLQHSRLSTAEKPEGFCFRCGSPGGVDAPLMIPAMCSEPEHVDQAHCDFSFQEELELELAGLVN